MARSKVIQLPQQTPVSSSILNWDVAATCRDPRHLAQAAHQAATLAKFALAGLRQQGGVLSATDEELVRECADLSALLTYLVTLELGPSEL